MDNFAVILNPNAKRVTRQTVRRIAKHVPKRDLYVTHSVEACRARVEELVSRKVSLIVVGGGDGTFMHVLEHVHLSTSGQLRAGRDGPVPRLAILRMGTGNGWAGLLKVPRGIKPLLEIIKKPLPTLKFTRFNTLSYNDRIFDRGGIGLDGAFLDGYVRLNEGHRGRILQRLSNGLFGYLSALTLDLLPDVRKHKFRTHIRITNRSEKPVFRASRSRGVEETGFKLEDTIFEGTANYVGFGTNPIYGFGFKILPFALEKPGCMALRILDLSVAKGMMNVIPLWTGSFEDQCLQDFLVSHISIECGMDLPFQLGGEAQGSVRRAEIKVSSFEPEILDFRA